MQYISSFSSGPKDETVHGATPLHLGSLHANLDGIQTLFDFRGDKATVMEMVLSNDSAAIFPFTELREGPVAQNIYMVPRDEIVAHVASTIKLFLTIAPDTINVEDNQGNNTLWYMVSLFQEHINQYYVVLKFLFELGADANMHNQNGMSMLHVGFYTKRDIDILGNTPLSQMAINLRQVEAVRALLRCGASTKVMNLKGDTPLHQAAHGSPLDARTKAQDEMKKVLEDASNGLDLMNENDTDGKTSRQLLEETRNKVAPARAGAVGSSI
ncbi:hypothetical protein ZTR_00968 [Talaromyces verruculosus]|nr:hypothetical protein ZTR_00968 [Talaromyces verruculosus]